MDKPEYAVALENRMEKVEVSVNEIKQNQSESFILQNATLRKLNEIQICLAGTEYDKEAGNGHGGGIVRRVSKTEKILDEFKIWKAQINTKNKLVWIFVSGSLATIFTILIMAWDKLF